MIYNKKNFLFYLDDNFFMIFVKILFINSVLGQKLQNWATVPSFGWRTQLSAETFRLKGAAESRQSVAQLLHLMSFCLHLQIFNERKKKRIFNVLPTCYQTFQGRIQNDNVHSTKPQRNVSDLFYDSLVFFIEVCGSCFAVILT